MKNLLGLLLLASTISFSQTTELTAFDNLIKKTWEAEGTWSDGSKFKQEIYMGYDLDRNIVLVKTRGFINEEQTLFGKRNHGIRMYDKTSGSFKFWEFDIFGGVTEGSFKFVGKDLYYTYNYGETTVTDVWEYVDDYTYNFKVGVYDGTDWTQLFLETTYNARRYLN